MHCVNVSGRTTFKMFASPQLQKVHAPPKHSSAPHQTRPIWLPWLDFQVMVCPQTQWYGLQWDHDKAESSFTKSFVFKQTTKYTTLIKLEHSLKKSNPLRYNMKMYNIERNWKAIWEYSHEENPNRDCLQYIKDVNYINFSKLRKDWKI